MSVGRLVGGNLSCLCACEGTKYATEREGEALLLLLEDVGEAAYRIDRMMMQLKNSGLIKGCAGIVLGEFYETDFNDFESESHFW